MTKILLVAAALIACTAAVAQQGGSGAAEFTFEDFIKQGYRVKQEPKPPEPPPKRELGPIDRWRYDSCRTEASKAPTKEGVRAGLQVCHEKFGQ